MGREAGALGGRVIMIKLGYCQDGVDCVEQNATVTRTERGRCSRRALSERDWKDVKGSKTSYRELWMWGSRRNS